MRGVRFISFTERSECSIFIFMAAHEHYAHTEIRLTSSAANMQFLVKYHLARPNSGEFIVVAIHTRHVRRISIRPRQQQLTSLGALCLLCQIYSVFAQDSQSCAPSATSPTLIKLRAAFPGSICKKSKFLDSLCIDRSESILDRL